MGGGGGGCGGRSQADSYHVKCPKTLNLYCSIPYNSRLRAVPLSQLSPSHERKKKIAEKNKSAPHENWERVSLPVFARRRFCLPVYWRDELSWEGGTARSPSIFIYV